MVICCLTQVHDQPTRDLNMLDLVFTNNPSTVKTSTPIPGISDHAMIVTDIDIIPQYVKHPASNLYGTHMGPMWAPICDPYGQCNRVPYGLAHVNKIKKAVARGTVPYP